VHNVQRKTIHSRNGWRHAIIRVVHSKHFLGHLQLNFGFIFDLRGHSTWMLQFRPLTLVRSTQSLPCSIQVQQVSSSTQSLCDVVA